MPESALQQAVTDVQASYDAIGAADVAGWLGVQPEHDRTPYVRVIAEQDWSGLEALAKERRAAYDAVADELLAHRAELLEHFDLNRRVESVFDQDFVPPRTRADWPELRTRLQEELRRSGVPRGRIAAFVAKIAEQDKTTLPRQHREVLRKREELLDDVAEQVLAGLMGTRLALSVAHFNRSVRTNRAAARDARACADDALSAVQALERDWYGALRSGAFPQLQWRAPAAANQRLDRVATAAGAVARARRDDPDDRDLGRTALHLGDAMRALLRNEALRLALVWLASDHPSSPPALRWLRSPRERRFPSRLKYPRSQSIAVLARQPSSVDDGAEIALEGTLGPVVITHGPGGAAISRATLRDRSGCEVTITTKHRKFDSAGMVEGAYARVAGNWMHRDAEAAGPGLVLSRHRYGDLAKDSWSDWATLQLRPLFEPSPQGLATDWSWQPGRDGAGNQLRYGMWSAERRGRRGGM